MQMTSQLYNASTICPTTFIQLREMTCALYLSGFARN